jgi:carboxyl-terminal processing protease
MNLKRYILLLIYFTFLGCNTPKKYLNVSLDIIEKHSIYKDSINWSEFRKDVIREGESAKNIQETYSAIRYALRRLGDNHSFFMTVESLEEAQGKNKPLPLIESELINENIAYIKIPAFVGNDSLRDQYAAKVNNIIKDFDKNYISGWIIDLRENNGGNMWPMLLGLGPILEKDTVGYFMDSEKNYSAWIYSKGEVLFEKNKIMSLANSHILLNKNRKKAILISGRTASSGEAVAIAFKGSKNTMFFGQNTKGLSTANRGFKLNDGAMIFLTVSKFADKNKSIYGTPIKPDCLGMNAKKNAIDWILNEQ